MDVESSTKPGISLAAKISSALRRDLSEGVFRPGDRLPSESALTREYSVSRTVVREAIAILRADGLVEARKGAGVFAIEVKPAKEVPFNDLAVGRISSVIELLELRTVFEVESAGLAASRRSAVQVESIVDAHRRVGDCLAAGLPTRDADFEFHLAIAQATQNRRSRVSSTHPLRHHPAWRITGAAPGSRPKDYNLHLQEEHAKIVDAIIEGDADAARQYMAAHLRGSLERYKVLLRSRTAAE